MAYGIVVAPPPVTLVRDGGHIEVHFNGQPIAGGSISPEFRRPPQVSTDFLAKFRSLASLIAGNGSPGPLTVDETTLY